MQNSVLVLPEPSCLAFLTLGKASILSVTPLPHEAA